MKPKYCRVCGTSLVSGAYSPKCAACIRRRRNKHGTLATLGMVVYALVAFPYWALDALSGGKDVR